jgi:hypothetical protein
MLSPELLAEARRITAELKTRRAVDVPDLGNVPGFDPSWALQTGVIN